MIMEKKRRGDNLGGRQTLPIGNDDFDEVRRDNSYYVDKSLMIKEFLDMNDKVALIARSRRLRQKNHSTCLPGQQGEV